MNMEGVQGPWDGRRGTSEWRVLEAFLGFPLQVEISRDAGSATFYGYEGGP